MSENGKIARQIAALPVHWDKSGKPRVLMVTSRDTGRWVMPKGWLMDGKKPWQAAKIEALEEAGAVGFISDTLEGAQPEKAPLVFAAKGCQACEREGPHGAFEGTCEEP
jgi:8-oxo-dGTP pyrophosphatase MutT (NUDIX family)